jgi:hypothetical protein
VRADGTYGRIEKFVEYEENLKWSNYVGYWWGLQVILKTCKDVEYIQLGPQDG